MKIYLATCEELPNGSDEDIPLKTALRSAEISFADFIWSKDNLNQIEREDLLLIRSTWDYFKNFDKFQHWLSAVEQQNIRCLNPVSTLRWNADKSYLLELASLGVSIPFTRLTSRQTLENDVSELLNTYATVVVKPAVSAGSHLTFCISAETKDQILKQLVREPCESWLIQEFLPEISEGEYAVMVAGGKLLHAVKKRPLPCEFRVQEQFGGTNSLHHPQNEELAFIQSVQRELQRKGTDYFYARIDYVLRGTQPLLMEAELIEPSFYWTHCQESAHRFTRLLQQCN